MDDGAMNDGDHVIQTAEALSGEESKADSEQEGEDTARDHNTGVALDFFKVSSRGKLFHPKFQARDIYVTRKRPLTVYIKRAQKIFAEFDAVAARTPTVRIFGAGATIKGALLLLKNLYLVVPHRIARHSVVCGESVAHDQVRNLFTTTTEAAGERRVATIQINVFALPAKEQSSAKSLR